MPKPLFKKNNLVEIIVSNINLLSKIDEKISINLKTFNKYVNISSDYEQISRVFFNLIKKPYNEKVKSSSLYGVFININTKLPFKRNKV